jgi:hypothetical protein
VEEEKDFQKDRRHIPRDVLAVSNSLVEFVVGSFQNCQIFIYQQVTLLSLPRIEKRKWMRRRRRR